MSKAKILIVEDEGITALNIKGLLENWGYKDPLIVLSSKDIFQDVAKYRPDLILMDINLNEAVDGIEIAKQLQADFDIPVVYLTAHSNEAIIERVKLTAYYGYIIKPFDNGELKITINQALYRHKMEKRLRNANKRLQIELEEKNRIQEELKESENKFRGIVEQSHDGIVIVDKNGILIEWNYGMEELTGYKREHVLGKPVWAIHGGLHPENDRGIYIHSERDVMQFIKNSDYNMLGELFEVKISSNDGSRRFIQVKHFPIKINGINMAASIVRDVTKQKEMEEAFKQEVLESSKAKTLLLGELKIAKNNLELKVQKRTLELKKSNEELKKEIKERKQAENSLKESESYYKTIFENTGAATFIIEEDTTISLVNAEFEKLCGYSKEEIEGIKSWKEFVFGNYVTKMETYHNVRRVDSSLTPRKYEFQFVDRYGNVKDILATIDMIYGTKKSLASILDITDKKMAIDALRENEIQLKMAMDMAKLVHWEYDVDSDLYTFDNQFYKLYGTTVDREGGSQMSSKEYAQKFLPPEESHMVEEEIAKTLEADDPNFSKKVEHSIIRADGEKRFILVRCEIIKDSEGRTVKTYGVNQDITELKRAERELKENEQKYRTLFNSSPDYTILIGIDGILIDVNDASQEIMGESRENLIGKNIEELGMLIDEELHLHAEKVSQVLNGKNVEPYESRFVDKDGNFRHVETYVKALEKDNEIFAFNVIAHDITKRKGAEKEIEKNLKKLDTLNRVIITANSSNNLQSLLKDILNIVLEFMGFEAGGIYLIDFKNRIAKLEHFKKDSNDSADIIGRIKIDEYPFSQVYVDGMSLFVNNFDAIPIEDLKPRSFKSLAVVPIYSKRKIIGSFNILSKNEHYFTQKEKDVINSIGREIGSTISKLVTEEKMKKLIIELKRSNDELQQFAYITSHDLQEPLRTIASFTQLLERRYKHKLDSDADEFIEYIVEASVRMKQMILDLLEYSRLTRLGKKCKPLEIEGMLPNIFDNLNLLIIENKAQITYDALPQIFADESQLFRVFQNLIENAIKFKREDETPKIHISSYFDEENNEHVFSVSDNGIGIEEQYFDRIFTLFQRLHTREEYGGTGIGLSISKRIIESHGGRMWVKSESGRGSTFYFTICAKPVVSHTQKNL